MTASPLALNTTKESNLNDILYAFYMTMELWIFLAVLGVSILVVDGWR